MTIGFQKCFNTCVLMLKSFCLFPFYKRPQPRQIFQFKIKWRSQTMSNTLYYCPFKGFKKNTDKTVVEIPRITSLVLNAYLSLCIRNVTWSTEQELGELEMILTQNIHNIIRVPCKWGGIRCRTMRLQENRGLTKHDVLPSWMRVVQHARLICSVMDSPSS
jgi:hypothetical protein